MNVTEVLTGIFATKEAKDLIINEIVKGIITIINSNKTEINSAMADDSIEISDALVKINFEKDIESISPGNPFNTWDESTSSYKNLNLNLLWQTYKASAYKHCKTTNNATYNSFLKQLEEIQKQFAKDKKQSFPGFGSFPAPNSFPKFQDDNSFKDLGKLVDNIFNVMLKK